MNHTGVSLPAVAAPLRSRKRQARKARAFYAGSSMKFVTRRFRREHERRWRDFVKGELRRGSADLWCRSCHGDGFVETFGGDWVPCPCGLYCVEPDELPARKAEGLARLRAWLGTLAAAAEHPQSVPLPPSFDDDDEPSPVAPPLLAMLTPLQPHAPCAPPVPRHWEAIAA
jgi:hypothetical protein